MPELPDIVTYVEALEARLVGQPITEVRLKTPFLLRTVEPPLDELVGKRSAPSSDSESASSSGWTTICSSSST